MESHSDNDSKPNGNLRASHDLRPSHDSIPEQKSPERSPATGEIDPGTASSAKKSRANRDNSKHSTGPNTDQGKRWSSQNARMFGLTAPFSLLPDEDPDAYAQLRDRLHAERPTACLACHLRIDQSAEDYQMLARIHRVRAGYIRRIMEEARLERAKQRVHACEKSLAMQILEELQLEDKLITDEARHGAALEEVDDAAEALGLDELLLASAFLEDSRDRNFLMTLERYTTTFSRRIERHIKRLDDCSCPKAHLGVSTKEVA